MSNWTALPRRFVASATRPLRGSLGLIRDTTPPAATGPIEVACRHLSPSVAAQVDDWFQGRIQSPKLSGLRSVIIPHPEDPERRIKIKGAGHQGMPLRFDRRQDSGLKAPIFDHDGRVMEDVASGHDNAFHGGASFQQVSVEYRVSARLAELGHEVVPCLGYGTVRREGRTSWFSVFDWHIGWESLAPPHFPIERYAQTCIDYGAQVIELASRHRLLGYYWYVATPPDGLPIIKDVHPFHVADPINMSRLSWTLHVTFALHIVALTALLSPRIKDLPDKPADLQAYPFRSLVADATAAEHEELRWNLVAPYIRDGPPKDFDPFVLERLLREHRITRAIMERCPPEFEALAP